MVQPLSDDIDYGKNLSNEFKFCASNGITASLRIIIGDETWVYEYDIETAQQSGEWRSKNEPKPKKEPLQSLWEIKVMLIIFFHYCVVVHHEVLPDMHTIGCEKINKSEHICSANCTVNGREPRMGYCGTP